MAVLGVIGGLGPMATAYFLELITSMTDAERDQDHLQMMICHAPNIPDRTAYILGKSDDDPLPGFIRAGQTLKSLGVDLLAIPCVTAHYFHSEIERQIGLKTLHTVRECVSLLSEAGAKKVGILATEGTVSSGLFQKELREKSITAILPTDEEQKLISRMIFSDIKCGNAPDMNAFNKVCESLRSRGAEVLVLGCTELSLIKRDHELGDGFADVLEILAKAALTACGKPIRPEYQKLFSPRVDPI